MASFVTNVGAHILLTTVTPFARSLINGVIYLFHIRPSSLLLWARWQTEEGDFVCNTTPWPRRRCFVLSLIETLLLFIGAKQPRRRGRRSYVDPIEGLHYLEASYFLFSLKGRVSERISLARREQRPANRREGGGGREGGESKGASYKDSDSAEQRQITPEQQRVWDCTPALC